MTRQLTVSRSKTSAGTIRVVPLNSRAAEGVQCRFHDLRHTAVTRMLEGGVPLAVVSSLVGWSAATAVRMAKRYGHIGNEAHLQAVAFLEAAPEQAVGLAGRRRMTGVRERQSLRQAHTR